MKEECSWIWGMKEEWKLNWIIERNNCEWKCRAKEKLIQRYRYIKMKREGKEKNEDEQWKQSENGVGNTEKN